MGRRKLTERQQLLQEALANLKAEKVVLKSLLKNQAQARMV
jgi:hypothetical protein